MTTPETERDLIEAGRPVQPELDLATLMRILRQRRHVLAAAWMGVMLVLGVFYLIITPAKFEATTVVQIEQSDRPVVSTTNALPEVFATPEVLKTFEQDLDSGALLLRVGTINHVEQDPRYLAEGSVFLRPLNQFIGRLFSKEDGGGDSKHDAKLIRLMSNRTSVKLRRGTRLIDVSVQAEDPTLAVQLSRSLVDEYIRLDLTQRLEASKPARDYLLAETDQLKEKLQKSEQALVAYKEEQHAVSLEDSQNIVVDTLKSLNANLGDATAARMKLEAQYSQVIAGENRPLSLISMSAIASSPEIQALKQRISEVEGIVASIGQRYTDKSPRYMQAVSELQKLNLSLDKSVRDAAGVMKESYASAKQTEDKLLAAREEQEKRALDLNRIAIQYNALSREVDSDSALYQAALKQLKESQLIQGAERGNIRIVETATIPDKPASPKKRIVLAVALLLGVLFGSAAAVGPVLYKSPLTGISDAESQIGIPVLTAIPKGGGRRGPSRIFLIDNPASAAAEAFRSLRAVLLSPARNSRSKTVMLASAVSGEGKSFCALNLAAALAIDGRRTLFIETDLRTPTVGRQLFGKKPPAGVSDILSGGSRLQDAIQISKVENLHILTAGSPTDRPSELLGSNRMTELMQEVAGTYEHIIMDSSAVLKTGDALRIAKYAQTVCIVARCGRTPGAAVARAVQLIGGSERNLSTVLVLNGVVGDAG